MAARIARERDALREALAVIADELGGNLAAPKGDGVPAFEVRAEPNADWPEGMAYQLVLGDQPIQPGIETVHLMRSIVQDFGHIPSEYLEAAGHGLYHCKPGAARERMRHRPSSPVLSSTTSGTIPARATARAGVS